MVSNFSQYSPQGLASQFPGLQGAGWPQMSPGLFGQPGMSGGNVSFGQDSGQALQHPAQHLVTVLGQPAACMQHVDGADDVDSSPLCQEGVQAFLHNSHIAHDENAQRRACFL